jgi:asparagine synthase (glutamine-hydrolysing)
VSGFAAVVNFDGSPVDRQLLDRMASYLSFRGPDGQRVWVGGWNRNVGLVHARFATTYEEERERQPLTVDGNAWIAGHIRVDARDELWNRLAGKERQDVRQATDAELVLHAYAASGHRSLEHLLGDFGFALWDAAERMLWCATDPMGIRPVFYERHHDTVVVSNTLDCVRLHPDSSDRLNELAIADFLVHDFNPDPTSTAYATIGRIGPGATLSFLAGQTTARTYWELPASDPVLGRRPDAVLEELQDLLVKAVRDRIRTRTIAIYVSGGLDSPALAACAARLIPDARQNVIGYCYGFRQLIPDDEFHFARLVRDRIGVEVRFRYRDESCFDPAWHERPAPTPEPSANVWSFDGDRALHREIAGAARVAFYGEGPDNALVYDWHGYLGHLARRREWMEIARGCRHHVSADRQASALKAGIGWLKRKIRPGATAAISGKTALPAWLNRDLAARLKLAERQKELWSGSVAEAHPWRPRTYGMLKSNLWRRLFDSFDPAMYGVPGEVRHPYLDVRLLRFFLALPVIPWCRDKAILREAMKGVLPDEVIDRKKTPLRADPIQERVKALAYRYPVPRAAAMLSRYVEPRALPAGPAGQTAAYYEDLRLFALDHWFACRTASGERCDR